MGLKDAFFKVLVGNNTTDNDIKKSAEVAEKAIINAEQPEIEKVEEVIKPVDETTGTSFITGEPEKELDEEPEVKEDEVEDNSAITEIHTEEPVEIDIEKITETSPETDENIEEVENTTETVDTVEKVNETAEDIIKPIIDPTADDYENCVYEEVAAEQSEHIVEEDIVEKDPDEDYEEKEYDAIAIDNEKLTKLENAIVFGIHSIFSAVRELLEKEDK